MNTTEQTNTQPQTENQAADSCIALAAKEDHAPRSAFEPQPCTLDAPSTSGLQNLLNTGSYRVKEERALVHRRTVEPASQPSNSDSYECVITAPPAANACPIKRLRNGKIARLPKLERDLVNKLLHNHVPHSRIVWALSEHGITVTQRNISNWRTRGGYKEWCAEQENQVRLAHLQDHLTDYLRKHDAQQLPEVGLQVASTQLTALLMNPQTAAPLLADPNKYVRVVEALDKCSARLNELQKERYENARRASIRDTVPHLLHEETKEVAATYETASATLGERPSEDIPHRNNLPPREKMPYRTPGPTIGEMIQQQIKALGVQPNPKQLADAPSKVAQPAASGNPVVT
jgi:hypothetical protein